MTAKVASMVRWGIVGLGRIAGTEIAPAINASKNGVLQAVVSRDQGRADSFAQQHQAARGLTDYAQMLADPEGDAGYIATPNAPHADHGAASAEAGQHGMCPN